MYATQITRSEGQERRSEMIKQKYWIRYTVAGSTNEKTITDIAVSESAAKRHVRDLYRGAKVKIAECVNTSES